MALARRSFLRINPIINQVMKFSSVSFESAVDQSKRLTKDPGNEKKLEMYALYKQATIGACTDPKPSAINFIARAKWDAWNTLGSMSSSDAKQKYIQIVDELAAAEQQQPARQGESTANAASTGDYNYNNLLVELSDHGAMYITLNRPKKFNALTIEMYNEISDALEKSATDPSVKIVAITGSGRYFCSGNDLTSFQQSLGDGGLEAGLEKGRAVLHRFVKSFIDFPKPLIGLVNGPAVGISVTTLGLYDVVVASDQASFHCPFTELGQTAEGCSSFMFPRIMGLSLASEVLYFGRKLSAGEALKCSFISRIIAHDDFPRESRALVQYYASLPRESMLYSKELVRSSFKPLLHETNDKECKRLVDRWASQEFMEAIMKFFQRQQAKKAAGTSKL